jgi:predicted NAD/FAD-binding protein
LEWSGNSLNTVFAQRSNLWNGAFWRMLMDLLRFNRLATAVAQQSPTARLSHQSLGDFLREHRFSQAFSDGYLLPMLGCIWSCPTDQMLHFPVATLVRFCHNHGLLQITGRPRWFTVAGGARQYVEKIVARIPDARLNCPVRLIERDESGVRVITDARAERFDKLVLATHSDQALALLRNPSAAERETLGAVRYQANQAVLHTDASVLPAEKSAWAAWNYERGSTAQSNAPRVCLHYLINRLQPLPFAQPVIVSLNPLRPLAPAQVLGTFDYAHPVFDATAIAAQSQIPALQGQKHTYYAGAWMGYGFHEDGLKAGLSVARALLPLAQR